MSEDTDHRQGSAPPHGRRDRGAAQGIRRAAHRARLGEPAGSGPGRGLWQHDAAQPGRHGQRAGAAPDHWSRSGTRAMSKAVDKAIREAGLGLNPQTEGQTIRVPIPDLNEERRKELTRVAAKYAEQARVSVRNVRRDGIDLLKKQEKDGEITQDEHRKLEKDIQTLDRRAHQAASTRCWRRRTRRSCRSDGGAARDSVARRRRRPMSRSSWTATGAGRRRAACRASPAIAAAPRRCAAPSIAAAELGISYLTLFGFSSENWKRPRDEVDDLMGLLRHLSARRDRRAASQRRAPAGHRRSRAARARHRHADRQCRGADARQHAAQPDRRALLWRPRRDRRRRRAPSPPRLRRDGSQPEAIDEALLRRAPLHRRHSRSRSAHPHQRRAAHQQFPAVAIAPMPSSSSPTRCGPISARAISRKPCANSMAAIAATAPPLAQAKDAIEAPVASRAARPGAGALKLRLASAAVLGPLALAAAWFGGWFFAGLVALAGAGMGWEWARLSGAGTGPAKAAVIATALAAIAVSALGAPLPAVALCLVGAAAVWAVARSGAAPSPLWTAAGTLWLAFLASRCCGSGSGEDGRALVFWLFAVVWASDIGAYAAGRALGGPRLAPHLSPNKTWSGASGGLRLRRARRRGGGASGRRAGRHAGGAESRAFGRGPGRRSRRIARQATLRRQGFGRAHSRPWRAARPARLDC